MQDEYTRDRLVTPQAASELLGVPIAEVRALVRLGHIRSVVVSSKSLRVWRSSVLEWAQITEDPTDALRQRVTDLEVQVAVLNETVGAFLRSRRISRGRLPKEQVERIMRRDGVRCRYCGRKTDATNRVLDHLVSWSKGGQSDDNNLVVSCSPCNNRKGPALAFQRKMTLRPSPHATAEVNAIQQGLANGLA